MMKKTSKFAALVLLPLAAMNVAAANFPVGTHLYKGTLKDWQNKVLTSSAAVTVQAVATNGTVIASTTVGREGRQDRHQGVRKAGELTRDERLKS